MLLPALQKHWSIFRKNGPRQTKLEEICIVGGGEIYRQSLHLADKLYVTHIMAEPEGDTHFPDIDEAKWRVVSRESTPISEKDTAETIFVVYERNSVV